MGENPYTITCEPQPSAAGASVTAIVRLAGEFDLAARDDLGETLRALAASKTYSLIIVDLSGVRFIDSEAIGAIIDGYVASRGAGVGFRLHNARGVIQRIFDILGLSYLFDPHPSEAARHDG